jgi:hypothetical protein
MKSWSRDDIGRLWQAIEKTSNLQIEVVAQPAIEAGLTDHVWSIAELISLITSN